MIGAYRHHQAAIQMLNLGGSMMGFRLEPMAKAQGGTVQKQQPCRMHDTLRLRRPGTSSADDDQQIRIH